MSLIEQKDLQAQAKEKAIGIFQKMKQL